MMVMIHEGEKRCPYCMSRRLKIIDYGLADDQYQRRGKYWFQAKCDRCSGYCEHITNLEDKKIGESNEKILSNQL